MTGNKLARSRAAKTMARARERAVATRATTMAIVSREATSTVAMTVAILPAMAMVDSVLDVGNDPLGGSDNSITGCRPPGDCYCEIVCPELCANSVVFTGKARLGNQQ